jgi:hypothetical protein
LENRLEVIGEVRSGYNSANTMTASSIGLQITAYGGEGSPPFDRARLPNKSVENQPTRQLGHFLSASQLNFYNK